MKKIIADYLQSNSDAEIISASLTGYLEKKSEHFKSALSSVFDVTIETIDMDYEQSLTYIGSKFEDSESLMVNIIDDAGNDVMSIIELKDLAIAMVDEEAEQVFVTVGDTNDKIAVSLDVVLDNLESQSAATMVSIESVTTLVNNASDDMIDSTSGLLSEYNSRIQIAHGVMNPAITEASSRLVTVLDNGPNGLKERAMAVFSFFGFDRVPSDDGSSWDGLTGSEFEELTGVSPLAGLVVTTAKTVTGAFQSMRRTIGNLFKKVVPKIISTAASAIGVPLDTLTGKKDAFDSRKIPKVTDHSFEGFGPTLKLEVQPSVDYNHIPYDFNTLNGLLFSVSIGLENSEADPEYSGINVNNNIMENLMFLSDRFNAIGYNFTTIQNGVVSLLVAYFRSIYYVNQDEFNDKIGIYLNEQEFNDIKSLDLSTDLGINESIPARYRNIISVVSLLDNVVSQFTYNRVDNSSFGDLKGDSYLKFQLPGSYVYAFKRNNFVYFTFRWIPINPAYAEMSGQMASFVNTGAINYSDLGVNFAFTLDISDFSDFDFGTPENDAEMARWVRTAQFYTAYSLAYVYAKSRYADGVTYRTIGSILETITGGLVAYSREGSRNTYKYGNSYTGNVNNLQLAEILAGRGPQYHDGVITVKQATNNDLAISLSEIIGILAIDADDDNDLFVPFVRTTKIKPGRFKVRTDRMNIAIAGAAMAAIVLVAAKVGLFFAVKSLNKKKFMLEAKQRNLMFNENTLNEAYKMNRKIKKVNKLLSLLGGVTKAADDQVQGLITGSVKDSITQISNFNEHKFSKVEQDLITENAALRAYIATLISG